MCIFGKLYFGTNKVYVLTISVFNRFHCNLMGTYNNGHNKLFNLNFSEIKMVETRNKW